MRRPSRSQALVGLLVVVMLATPAAALSIPEQSRTSQVTTNESVAPGEQLAGVVGVGQAELDGAVEGRALAQSVTAADSNRSKAAVVSDHVTDLQTRLGDLEDRRAELQTARESGDIDRGVYQVRTATLAARTQQVERQLNWSRQAAVTLPEQARTAAGLNVSTIERLRTQAGELRGGAVGDIARGMVGPGVGNGMPDRLGGGPPAGMPGNQTSDPGPPGSSGSPGDNGNDRRNL